MKSRWRIVYKDIPYGFLYWSKSQAFNNLVEMLRRDKTLSEFLAREGTEELQHILNIGGKLEIYIMERKFSVEEVLIVD